MASEAAQRKAGVEPGVESSRPALEPSGAPEAQADIKQLLSIIKGTRTCMFTTKGPHGYHARPMAIAHIDYAESSAQGEPPVVWFLTSASCTKIDEIKGCPEVVLAFQNDMSNSWASITGKAELVDDKSKAKELWSGMYDAWFPGGPESSTVMLIRVVPTCAAYWQGSILNRLHIMFSALAAKVTGKAINQGATQEQKSITFEQHQQGAALSAH